MRLNIVIVLSLTLLISFASTAMAQVEVEQRVPPPLGPANPLAFDDVIVLSSQLLNHFWNNVFAENGMQYAMPAGFYWYNEEVPSNCGATSLNNAFFCPADRTIWFHYDFLLTLYNNIGDYAAAHVLAHEWGHLVQFLLGVDNQGFTIFTELQADCFAGVFAAFAANSGYLDQGDVQEAVVITYQLGDPAGFPWFEFNAHGTSDERVAAFALGFDHGLASCNFDNMAFIIDNNELARPTSIEPQVQPLTITPLMRGGNAYGLDIRSGNAHEIILDVYDVSGQRVYADSSYSGALRYHGLDQQGRRLANGVYLYVVTTRQTDGAITRSEVKKLVIVR
jgi:hypothetical protein